MADPNTNFSEIVTTTLRKRSKKLSDNLSNNTALLFRLKERGKQRTFAGGRTIVEELAYSGPGNFMYYSGYDTLNINQQTMLTAAEFNIKQAAVAISISGLEMLQNMGPEAVIDLLASRIEQGEREMVNNMSTGLYSDGTGSGGKQVGGLQLLISSGGTGTVGGIDAGTYTWWKNYTYDFSDHSTTAGSTTIQAAMNDTYLNTSRNRDHVDLIVADNNYYGFYWASLQANQRFTSPKLGEAGFDNLKFKNADVVFDGGLNGSCPSNRMYFLNTDYIWWRPHSQRNMVPLNPDRYATNQDALVKLIAWAGNMTVANRALQAVLQA